MHAVHLERDVRVGEAGSDLIEITVSGKPGRIDLYLAQHLPLSRSRIRQCMDAARVRVNQVLIKPSFKVKPGDRIQMTVPPRPPLALIAQPMTLDIVHEDEALLIVNKPAGLVVHPAPGHPSGTLVNGLLYYCQDITRQGGRERPGLVHRLDKDTSGILVVAKTDFAHQFLSGQFKDHTIERAYLALVAGVMKNKEGKIILPMGRDRNDRKKISPRTDRPHDAETHFTVLQRFPIATLLRVSPRTGRTHQIRVHLAHLNYPVVGDPCYGGRTARISALAPPRQMLHAETLGFVHPLTKKKVSFSSPLPEDFQEILNRLAL